MEKLELFEKRRQFFEHVLENINRDPIEIDKVLSQDAFYVKPDKENTFYAVESGDLAICVKGNFFEKDFSVWYSAWQFGDYLKIGVAFYDNDLQGILITDDFNESHYLWGNDISPRVDVSHGCVLYEWEFDVPNLYDNYKNQERFILGMRHMHFRVMRIIHDECRKLHNEGSVDIY